MAQSFGFPWHAKRGGIAFSCWRKKNQGGASKENQQAKHTRESRKQS
jgi:hypothetical protein